MSLTEGEAALALPLKSGEFYQMIYSALVVFHGLIYYFSVLGSNADIEIFRKG